MKILHIITGLKTGGAERALFNLLNGGLLKTFNCIVVSLTDEGTMGTKIKSLGVPVVTLGMRNGCISFSGLLKLHRLLREFRADIVQGWMYHGNLVATLACALATERPLLVWNIRHSLYDLEKEKFMTQQVVRLNRLFSSGPDVLLYNSQLSQKQHEKFGFSSKKSQVIPNGIDIQKFSFSSKHRQKARSELGILKTTLVVGHVARFHPIKDHSLFLEAAVDIAQRITNVHFLLSGRGISIENKSIKKLVPVGLRNRFYFLGERADVPELMCAMDIFCLSSWSEAFPNVIGEAMAVGLPCVATNVGDTKIIIGETGVVVPARDRKNLIFEIDKLLKLPQKERRSLGDNARARIEENYTLSAIVKQYSSLYERLNAEKR